MIFREDKGTGYMYCYAPDHYCANKAGKVLEHVKVMADYIGRKLLSNECVHHIDRDRKNNKITNLMLLTQQEHMELHAIEDKKTNYYERQCKNCGKLMRLSDSTSHKVSCSVECSIHLSRNFEITSEDLHKLVWSMPTAKVAEVLGVSDVAVAKRCKRLGVDKPPRGYWRKVQTGKIQIDVNQNNP